MTNVTLKRSGILVAAYGLSPEIRDRLTSAMEYDHRSMEPNGRGGLQAMSVKKRLWMLQDDGSLIFQCGFVPTVYRIVEEGGGQIVEYTRLDRSGDLEFDLSKLDVENLREGQEKMLAAFIANEGGLIVSPTGCHRAGQEVLLHSGRTLPVEEVEVGQLLLGPDGNPRTVQRLCRGRGQMARIVPVKGDPWVVNLDHVLTLVRTNDGTRFADQMIDVSVREWLTWSKNKKHTHKLIRSSVWSFPVRDLTIEPYVFGLLLGDGGFTGDVPTFTKPEPVLHKELREWADRVGVRYVLDNEEKGSARLATVGRIRGSSVIIPVLKGMGLWGKKSEEKHIPGDYLTAHIHQRLALLAGLLDTDGSLQSGCFEYSTASKRMSRDVLYLCRSLGFAAYCSDKVVNGKTYYRISISGQLSMIPTRVVRKQAAARVQVKDVLRVGFTVEELGTEDYFGFELDGDRRYLLGDFTITHNSGKSYGMREICAIYPDKNIIIAAPGIESVATLNRYLSEKFPGQVGQVGGGKRHTRRITIATFDSLMKVDTLGDTDILIVDEVHRAPAAKYAISIAACVSAVKRFGFTATADGRGDGAELLNTGMFGDIVLNIAFYEAAGRGEVVPVHLIIHEHTKGPNGEMLKNMQQANKDRRAIWRNDERNRLIANDARSLAEAADDPQILIIVGKAEHAYALGKLLPDFRIVTGDLDKKAREKLARRGVDFETQGVCSKKDREAFRGQFEQGKLRRVIATEIWSASVSSNDCDIVIFASGSGSTITFLQSLGRGTRVNKETDKQITTGVVYRDMFAPAYKARSDKLIKAAKSQGHQMTKVKSS